MGLTSYVHVSDVPVSVHISNEQMSNDLEYTAMHYTSGLADHAGMGLLMAMAGRQHFAFVDQGGCRVGAVAVLKAQLCT